MKSCEECKFCLLEDHGYSNYTVEGTYVHCLKGLHPDGVFDRFYGEAGGLNHAEKCVGYVNGCPVAIDVDREGQKRGMPLSTGYTDDVEVAPLVDAWGA